MTKIKAEEASRIKDIKSASKRKDKIQEEIDGLKKYNKDTTKLNKKKEADDLTSNEFLKIFENFRQKDSEQKEPTFEDNLGLIDWHDKKFHEPRALSIKNVRDIMFAILN